MSAKTMITTVDEYYAAIPRSEEQVTRNKALVQELTDKIAFHEGRDAATRRHQLINDLLPLMRNHPEKINELGNIILNEYGITADRITRRIEGCELPPAATHYTHHTGNIEELTTLLTTGNEPLTNRDWKPVSPDVLASALSNLTARDISLLTYALRSHWVTPNQAWDVLRSSTLTECLLLASKLTDLNYGDTTLNEVVNGMRHAHEEWGTRNVHDPLDLSTDEKLEHNATIARATILAAGADPRYTRTPDHRLIRNRRTQRQTMQGIQLHERAVSLYRHYPDQQDEITRSLLVEGNSIMSTEALLNKAA